MHRKVLDKGVPEDVMPGIKNTKVSLICTFSVRDYTFAGINWIKIE